MRTTMMIAAAAIFVINSGSVSVAQVLTGKWSGQSPTTLEFLDGNKVKYCYKAKCTTQVYTGDRDKMIKFNWGQSKFTFTKTDGGYDGTFLRVMTAKVKIQ